MLDADNRGIAEKIHTFLPFMLDDSQSPFDHRFMYAADGATIDYVRLQLGTAV
ncbi:hypothetical protein [Paenibacillus hamazuiensis]|uniref:hypothetical protein n=1 Tax=Paenibacillus hamazuiensis TaxID=2936508 RepID=UPI00200BCFD0|nr:hypothetical protein [Paenibacillus hamazuiensis]